VTKRKGKGVSAGAGFRPEKDAAGEKKMLQEHTYWGCSFHCLAEAEGFARLLPP